MRAFFDIPSLNAEDARRRKLLAIMAVSAMACDVALMVVTFLVGQTSHAWAQTERTLYVASGLMLLGMAGIVLINRYWSGELAAGMFLLLLVGVFAISDTPLELTEGRTTAAFVIPVIAASVLLPPLASFAFAGICGAVSIAISLGISRTPNFAIVLVYFAVAVVAWASAHSLDQALQSLNVTNRDLAASEHQLRQAHAQNERLLSVIPSILIGIDDQDRVTRWNVAAESVFNREAGEMLNRRLTESQLGWDRPVVEACLKRCRSAGEIVHVDDLLFIRSDGQAGTLGLTLTPVIQDRATGILILGADITERKRAEDEIRRLNAALEQRVEQRTAELKQTNMDLARAMHAKDEFLASMSHELRSPLHAVLLTTETLAEGVYGELKAPQALALRAIIESGQHLLELINDILDVAKIEAGKLELILSPVSVLDVCRAAQRLVQEPALKKRLNIVTEFDPQAKIITADERRLKQILVNLLSNAVKYTPQGGQIGLTVHAEPETEVMRFTVWDTGAGISSENLEKLFKPFVQLDNSLTREHTGTGLGLSLVRGMVELHGGSVSVESVLNEGSRFTISLPWQPTTLPALAASFPDAPKAGPARPGEGQLILLADDSEIAVSHLTAYLQARGFQVLVARNGQEAVALAVDAYPSLILMDIQMPKMDGFEAIRQLRARPDMADVPIIALTAMAMRGDQERCLEAGANLYFAKPVRLPTLLESINSLIADRGAVEPRSNTPEAP